MLTLHEFRNVVVWNTWEMATFAQHLLVLGVRTYLIRGG